MFVRALTSTPGRKRRSSLSSSETGKAEMSAKKPVNAGKAWTGNDVAKLRQLASGNTPTRLMALKLGRTAGAVYGKAEELDLSLKPTNQRPYNRRKS